MKCLFRNFIIFTVLFLSVKICISQPLNCAGSDSNKIFFLGPDSVYRFDPFLPISATNPSGVIPAFSGNGLTISNNLNGGTPSPTFYSVNSSNNYEYWNGAIWVNTNHFTGNGAAVNIGGGVANIYNYVGFSNDVYKYTGAGAGTLIGSVQGNGPYDFATDNQDNFYFFNASNSPGHIYKYSPTAVLLDSIAMSGYPSSSAGGGFSYIGNIVMASFSGSDIWLGNVVANSVVLTNVGNINFTVSDVAQCPTTSQIPSTPNAKITFIDTNCGSLCVTPTNASTGGITTYQWIFSGGNPSTSAVANPGQVCFASAGAHTISLIITDTSGIVDTATRVVYVSDKKTIISTANYNTCKPGQQKQLSVSGATSYNWSPSLGLSCTNCNNPIASPNVSTNYIVEGTDAIGCKTKDTITIKVIPLIPNWNIPIDSICLGELLYGNSSSTGAGLTQTWIYDDGSSNTNGSAINPPHNYIAGGIYNLTLALKDTLGCLDTLSKNVFVASLPIANFETYPFEAPVDNPILNYKNTSTNGISYTWLYNSQQFSTDFNTSKRYLDTGSYCVTLVVCNELNCCDTIIKCNSIVPQVLGIPNVFTPDGNTYNDQFVIIAKNIEVNYIKVFDRWGNNVFTTTNKAEGWNGTFKNQPCAVGTYFYVIEYKKAGKNKIVRGDVNLIR